MIKNKIPLPLIGEVIDKLKETKYFNKIDLIWGYNNVQIKEDDEWKAASLMNKEYSNHKWYILDYAIYLEYFKEW